MQYHHTKREPEMAELIEGSERDRRRLAELLDGIRVGPGSSVNPGGLLRQSRCGIGGGQGAAGIHQKADAPLRQGPNEFGAVQVKRPVVQMGMGIK